MWGLTLLGLPVSHQLPCNRHPSSVVQRPLRLPFCVQPYAVRYVNCPFVYSPVLCVVLTALPCAAMCCAFDSAGRVWRQQLCPLSRHLCTAACAAMRKAPDALEKMFGTAGV